MPKMQANDGGVLRTLKKIQVNDGGVLRNLKKVQANVGGVMQTIFKSGADSVLPLSVARMNPTGASSAHHALFASGQTNGVPGMTTVDAYDEALVRSLPTGLAQSRIGMATAIVGDYVLFAGGQAYSDQYNYTVSGRIDAYDSSLVRTSPTALATARMTAGANAGEAYAVFAGGATYGSGESSAFTNRVEAYNTSLTRSLPTALTTNAQSSVGGSIGNYAVFSYQKTTTSANVEAYNSSLTKTTVTTTDTFRSGPGVANVGDYLLFAGGSEYLGPVTTVDAYNSSLTKSTPTALSAANTVRGASVDGYALFAHDKNNVNTVDVYNASLTRSTASALSLMRQVFSAASVAGSYALFAGGRVTISYAPYNELKANVDAYDGDLNRISST